MLNANTLVAPLNEPPTSDTDVTSLSQCNFIHIINHELNKMRPGLPPKVKYEVSEDKKEYVAYQKIPGYGAHFCYVYSGDPIVKTEQESGTPILDDMVPLEENVHPLIRKYVKQIRTCMPPKRTPTRFKYHDLTESFGGMKIPSVDPDDDVVQEYELVNTDGAIGVDNSVVASDLDGTDDKYDQFEQDPLHHDRLRLGLKHYIEEKEKERRVLMEERLKNQTIVRPEPSPSDSKPKIKQTVSTRVKTVHLKPITLGGNRVALVGRIPQPPSNVMPRANSSSLPSARRDLIQAMHDLQQEMLNSQDATTRSNDSSHITPNIQQAINKVWNNPLMRNLDPMSEQHVSLPPPPKIDFQGDLPDKHQSY